jgi:hypothetical protein
LTLLPRLRVRDFAAQTEALTGSMNALANLLTESVATVYELRAPIALASFRGGLATLIDNLIITDPLDTSLTTFSTFTSNVLSALQQQQFEVLQPNRHVVVASIPRSPTDCDFHPTSDGSSQQCGSYHPVSPTTAQQFWTSLDRSAAAALAIPRVGFPEAIVTLTPADLYVPGNGAAVLSCNDVAPVVRRMALFINTGGDSVPDFAASHFSVNAAAANPTSAVVFPTIGAPLAYDFGDPNGLGMELGLMNGSAGLDTEHFPFDPLNPSALGQGAGMSPFTSFDIDMTPMYFNSNHFVVDAFKNVRVVSLVFEVENVPSSPAIKVDLPGVCQPVTGPSGGPADPPGG